MRKLYTIFLAVVLTSSLTAQAPQKMSYQAVIRNSSDALVTNHLVGMKISILQGSSTGAPIFVETQIPTTNANGLVTIEIGSGTPVTGTLAGIDWSTGTYFIKTETDPTGGTSYSITGTSQILSVPYSFYSKTASTSADAVKITGDQSIAGNKTFTGTISASDKVITNIATPVNPTDASNKAYVDELKQRLMELEEIVYTNTPLPSTGLVAYYPFNGNANDGSGNGNNGTINGATLSTDRFGTANKAYLFNGTSNYISVPSSTSFQSVTNEFTYSVWLNINAWYITNNKWGVILCKGISDVVPHIQLNIGEQLTGEQFFGSTTIQLHLLSNNIFSTQNWHNCVVTSNGSATNFYVDGVLVGQAPNLRVVVSNDVALDIGRDAPGATEYFNGKLDDIRIYNRAINDSEIKQLYNEGGYPNTLVTDIDGNSYKTIKIGTQVWMAENLKTTRYQNGDLIGTTIPVTLDIEAQTAPKFQWAYEGNESNVPTFGRLYTWYAVTDVRNICPVGWHAPTDVEWTTMENYLITNGYNYDGTTVGNKIAKALAGTTNWTLSNVVGSIGNTDYPTKRNASGLTVVPSGVRYPTGQFYLLGFAAELYTATESSSTRGLYRTMNSESSEVYRYGGNFKSMAFAVRCIKN